MRGYYLTGLAAIAAMGAQLTACGGSERSFSDDTGGTGNSSSGGTGNSSSGGTGNTGNTSSGGTGASASGGTGNTGNTSSGGTGASASGGTGNTGNTSSGGTGASASGGTGAGGTAGSTAGGTGGTAGTGGGTQTVQCDGDNSNPANSSDVIADVTITYDPGTMMWSAPDKCDWECNTNYCEDANQCLDQKSVACDPDNSNPANSTDNAGNVTVTCSGTTFADPAKCGWSCNSGYCQELNSCLTTKSTSCDTNNSNPANSSDVVTNVNVSCVGGGWATPTKCAWNCNSGYCQEGNSCLSSKSVQCNTNNSNPANSTDVVANVNISCGSGGWPAPPLCNWTCNSGYVKSGSACVRPVYMFDGGGVSGAPGGRTQLDNLCKSTRSASYPSLPSTRVRAFISVSASDEIRDMPTLYQIPTTVPLVGPTGTIVADNWADLLDGTIDTTLGAAGVTSNFWYSGSYPSGAVNLNCTGWTATTVGGATYGRGVFTDSQWMATGSATCGLSSYHFVCLASY